MNLYACRSTQCLPQDTKDFLLVFFTGAWWEQPLNLLFLILKKRQPFPLAGEKKQNIFSKRIQAFINSTLEIDIITVAIKSKEKGDYIKKRE